MQNTTHELISKLLNKFPHTTIVIGNSGRVFIGVHDGYVLARSAKKQIFEIVRNEIADADVHFVRNIRFTKEVIMIDNQFTDSLSIYEELLDLILEPEDSEAIIGDLKEEYQRRLPRSTGHAKRWLFMQILWIAYGRVLDLYRQFVRARAGK